jgi:hypothetical protein
MRRHKSAIERIGRWPSIALSRSQAALEAVAFWGAVITPLAYLPALSLNGSAEVIATLLAVNVACLFVGYRHTPSLDAGILTALFRSTVDGGER